MNRHLLIIITVFSVLYISLYLFLEYKTNDSNYVPVQYTTSWYETEIEVYFNDGTKQVYTIDVFERPDNINVSNGNLSYKKCTKETGGVVARRVELASFVKNYIVLKSEFKTKTD